MGEPNRTVPARRVAWRGLGALVVAVLSIGAAIVPVGARAAVTPSEYSLLVEPANGLSAIYALIGSARHTVDMTMYELDDRVAEADLAADAHRGVKVRVVLDQNLAKAYNAPAYGYLGAHGVQVHWAPKSYDVTHQKTITVDGLVSAVMTLNLTSEYYTTSRDFAVIDRNRADVGAIENVFDHDFADDRSSPEPAGAELVWSPGSDARMVSTIRSAHHTLYVENEEMSEYTIVDALVAAAERGVDVEVVMTYQSSWKSDFDQLAPPERTCAPTPPTPVSTYTPRCWTSTPVTPTSSWSSGRRTFRGPASSTTAN